MQIQTQLKFAHNYEANVVDEWPSGLSGKLYYFPGAKSNGGKDGLMVEIHCLGKPSNWIGIFAFGMAANYKGYSAICSTPDPLTVLVVSLGYGCFVNVDQPNLWSQPPVFPVTDVWQVVEKELMLFSDHTTICAWGKKGLVWKSSRLVLDDLKIVNIESNIIRGNGTDSTGTSKISFAIDLLTGEQITG
jgi:hypothetical protein